MAAIKHNVVIPDRYLVRVGTRIFIEIDWENHILVTDALNKNELYMAINNLRRYDETSRMYINPMIDGFKDWTITFTSNYNLMD